MKIELSHDLLAKKIYDKGSAQDKMLIKISKFIKDRFTYFKENNVLLSKDDLYYIRPYLSQITLERHELIFIQRSQQAIWFKRALIGAIVVSVIFLIAHLMNRTEKVKIKNQELLAEKVAKYKKMEDQAKELSGALVKSRKGLDATKEELRLALLQLQEKNDTLIYSYAAYKVEQVVSNEQVLNDLHIAQSAKLSELAAPIIKQDKKQAFKLAVKAWHLNPENQQAMKTIYLCGGVPVEKTLSKQRTRNIIKKHQKSLGKLTRSEMQAIFNPKNSITADNKKYKPIAEQVEKDPPPTMLPPPDIGATQQQMTSKIKAQVNQIQQQINHRIEQNPVKKTPQ